MAVAVPAAGVAVVESDEEDEDPPQPAIPSTNTISNKTTTIFFNSYLFGAFISLIVQSVKKL